MVRINRYKPIRSGMSLANYLWRYSRHFYRVLLLRIMTFFWILWSERLIWKSIDVIRFEERAKSGCCCVFGEISYRIACVCAKSHESVSDVRCALGFLFVLFAILIASWIALSILFEPAESLHTIVYPQMIPGWAAERENASLILWYHAGGMLSKWTRNAQIMDAKWNRLGCRRIMGRNSTLKEAVQNLASVD